MMTACNSRSYLDYIYKSVDKYNNPYHHSIGKERIDTKYSALTEKLRPILKFLKLKLLLESELLSTNIFLAKVTPIIGREIFAINSMMKTNPWTN